MHEGKDKNNIKCLNKISPANALTLTVCEKFNVFRSVIILSRFCYFLNVVAFDHNKL